MLQIAYMGDDLNDLECMKSVGLSGCPADTQKEILPYCSFVSQKRGGEGVVREFLNIFLISHINMVSHNHYKSIHISYILGLFFHTFSPIFRIY